MGIDWNNRDYGVERDDDEPEDKEKAELYRRVEVLEEDLRAAMQQREKLLAAIMSASEYLSAVLDVSDPRVAFGIQDANYMGAALDGLQSALAECEGNQ